MTVRSARLRAPRRTGAAVAEFAVCLPVLIVLVFGALECTTMMFVKQSLHIVAYEGVRTAVRHHAQQSDVSDRCDEMIAERKLQDCQVFYDPPNLESVAPGTPITVRAVAPAESNNLLPLRFFGGDLMAEAVMFKE